MNQSATTAPTVSSKGERASQGGLLSMMHGLNALRVAATFFVLVAHAAIPYMCSPIRGTVWPLHDSAQHVGIDYLLFWVNGFAMPLFFLMAGISAAQACSSTPLREFAWHRLTRLSVPFLTATVLILPFCYLAWGVGFLLTERAPLSALLRMRFSPELEAHVVGPFHLWFLEYLLLISVGACAIYKLTAWLTNNFQQLGLPVVQRLLASRLGPCLFAIPTAVIVVMDPETPYRLPNTFIPDAMRLLHYSLFFMAGIWLAKVPKPAAVVQQNWRVNLLVASIVFLLLMRLILKFAVEPISTTETYAFAMLQASFSWLMVFGAIGMFTTLFNQRNDLLKFLNEASFWTYLAHLPLLTFSQLAVWPIPCWPSVKLLLVTLITTVLSLLSYQFCVRYSLLGYLTSGSRKRISGVPSWRLEAGWLGVAATIFLGIGGFLYVNRALFSGTNLQEVAAGKFYRSNRLPAIKLEATIQQYGIKSVISLPPAAPTDQWWLEQQRVCAQHGVECKFYWFYDEDIPSAKELDRLILDLQELPRPVLIQGATRTPTLSGLGAAVALLVDEVSPEEALQQLSWRYTQLEGAEHCIVARPLIAYRNWLREKKIPHQVDTFHLWTDTEFAAATGVPRESVAEQSKAHLIGAPRFPRWR